MRPRLSTLNALGAVAGAVAVLLLVVQRPEADRSHTDLPPPPQLVERATSDSRTSPMRLGTLRLHNLRPPISPAATLNSTAPLEFRVSVPPDTLPWGLAHRGQPLLDAPWGATLRVDPQTLWWGLNPIHIEGVDRFGRPIDRAWPLVVGDSAQGDGWIRDALGVVLSSEGFIDDDRQFDDLSSIAERQVRGVLRALPPLEAGPVTASNFRAVFVDVQLHPEQGSVAVHLGLGRVLIDVQIDPFGPLEDLVINSISFDARLAVEADVHGRPRVRLIEIEPQIDLVETGEGVVNWILDHAAWFAEIAIELFSQEPLQEAITGALDDALARWVSSVQFSSVPPLSEQLFEVGYRFGELSIDEGGLVASVDFRVGCPDDRPRTIGRLVRPATSAVSATRDLGESVFRVWLTSDAINGALHAMWRCGALDTRVGFAEAQREMSLFVPEHVSTDFQLPPILQSGEDGGMVVGVGELTALVTYRDVTYEIGATGLIPIQLEATPDGRALEVGFDPDLERVALYTDCARIGRRPCRDNVLFDRLAWLAVPFLPPIGATIPIPDLRLSDDPSEAVEVRLDQLTFDSATGLFDVLGSYGIVDP